MSTSPRIRQLDDTVANQIAAGEVVERPASVVKELVENALDAEATRIRVEVEEGGARRIRVTDDGVGMGPEDARLCLQRHATSKIRGVEDLETVTTLGFRGEAVPSIASVSRFTLTTCLEQAEVGTRVSVEGGRVASVVEIGAPRGTTIDVADLFFNVPARRKFLKRPQTELSHISEGLVRLAMCRPQVGLRLATEHKVLLDVPPGVETDPRGRIGRILGADVAERLHPIVEAPGRGPVRVSGFAAEPGLSERGTKGLYTFVNGRFVKDRTIQHAVQDAYRTLLERGRYPVVVLFLEVDPSLFDVNVHPQKIEVRFARTGDIHRAVTGALGRTVAGQPWSRRSGLGSAGSPEPPFAPDVRTHAPQGSPSSVSPLAGAEHPNAPGRADLGTAAAAADPAASVGPDGFAEHAARAARARGLRLTGGGLGRGAAGVVPRIDISYAMRAASPNASTRGEDRVGEAARDYRAPDAAAGADAAWAAAAPAGAAEQLEVKWSGRFSELEPVGQVLGTYLVCQASGRMVLIDQHAAHERVMFQKLQAQRRTGAVEVQPLLLPLVLSLDPPRLAAIPDLTEELAMAGIHVERLEEAGEERWQLRAAPAALAGAKLGQLVNDVLDELREMSASVEVEQRIDAMLSCAACHGSVRAKDKLHKEEIRALLRQMDEIDFGAFCPHGRPVFVEFDERALARMFHRS